MRIGIDARFVGPQGTGLGKYTEKLIYNLANIDCLNQYVIFLKKDNWHYLNIKRQNFKKVLADIPWYSLQEQLKMPGILKKEKLDLLHVPHFNVPVQFNQKFVVTIHDLIHHKFSEHAASTKNPLIFKIKRFAYRKVIENAVYKSAKIITPSNFVKEEILKNFKISPQKIVVTYEAAEEEYFQNSHLSIFNSQLLEKFSIRKPFLIYVGNAYAHKNLNRLLEAMRLMENLKLVLVCPRDIFWQRLKSEIEKKHLKDRVELKGFLAAEELSLLFQEATAYVFPTLAEGFGIPALNAMAAGLPVLASDIPTLKEIYGDAALYFDPQDPKDIADKIKRLLSNEKARADLVKKGKEQLKKYSWLKMAQETLKVYESI